MKKIYTITLEEEDYLSGCFKDNLRLVASMVYDQIYNYIDDNCIPLNINKNIVYNNINYVRHTYCEYYGDNSRYIFDSDEYDDGYINYEPFIVGNKTFGLTIIDDSFDEIIIYEIVRYVFSLLKLNYKISIDSVSYESKDIDDETHRDEAINKIYEKFAYVHGKRTKFIRLMKKTFCRK